MSFEKGSAESSDVSFLRFKWIWLALGILQVGFVIVLSLIDLAPISGVLLQDKLMHMLAYGLLMGWFAQIYQRSTSRLVLAVALVVMGVGIEVLQGLVGYRQFDKLDMVANSSGVLLAWLLSYTWLGRIFLGFESLIPQKSS